MTFWNTPYDENNRKDDDDVRVCEPLPASCDIFPRPALAEAASLGKQKRTSKPSKMCKSDRKP